MLAAAESSDADYDGLNAGDVPLTNIDNETDGVTLDFGAGLTTSEDGGDATFRIVLNAQPTANVTFSLESSDGARASRTTAGLASPANWNAPQIITVTGVDDNRVDGPQPYTMGIGSATSSDSAYSGLAGGSVPLLQRERQPARSTAPQVSAAFEPAKLARTQGLPFSSSAQPAANVTLRLSSSDTSEGIPTPGSLVFTPANWDAPRTVTVTGVDDDLDDGNQVYTIVTAALTSSDPNYEGLNVLDFTVTNLDNDTPGITVIPLTATTTEAGSDDTFRVVPELRTHRQRHDRGGEQRRERRPGRLPGTLTFTPANWDAPRSSP